jgi:FkbM family methyltransferase
MKGDHQPSFRAKWQFLRGHAGFRHSPVLTLFRLAFWRVRCALGRPTVVILPRWDVRMYLPAEWRGFPKLMFAFREMYEPELCYLEKLLSPGMTFVDVGACYGIYTLVASKLVGSGGRVIAFEPTARSYSVLQENIRLNGLGNVGTYQLAISNRPGTSKFYHSPDSSRNSLGATQESVGPPEEVEAKTLDTIPGSTRPVRIDVTTRTFPFRPTGHH